MTPLQKVHSKQYTFPICLQSVILLNALLKTFKSRRKDAEVLMDLEAKKERIFASLRLCVIN